jgi:Spy/CpxP family protein refolding chaperone
VSPWKVILATMVIFACGIFTGVFVTRIEPVAPPAPAVAQPQPASTNKVALPGYFQLQMQRPEFLKRMDRQLDLTPEQHDQIAKIMKDSTDRTIPIWQKVAPEMNDELKRVRDEVRQVLTPEQRKRWMELMKRGRPGNAHPAQPGQAQTPPPSSL